MSLHSVWNLYPEGQTRVLGKIVTQPPILSTAIPALTITRFTGAIGTFASWAIVAATGAGGAANTGYVEIGGTFGTGSPPKIYLPANPTATPALTPSYFVIPIPVGSVIDLYEWTFRPAVAGEGVIVYYGI